MPRVATIKYDDFKQAARALLAKGEALTFAAVRLKLGGGSYDVLRRYIDQFAEETGGEPQRPEVSPAMQALHHEIREDALKRARDELSEDAQALESERQALQLEQAQWQERLVQAETEARLQRDRVDELQREREALHARVDREQQRAHELERQADSLQGALSAERESRTALTAQWVQERQQLVDRFLAALEQAEARFEGLQQHALRLVDEVRTKHVATVETLLREHLQAAGDKVAGAAAKAFAGLPERLVNPSDVDQVVAARMAEYGKGLQASIEGASRDLREHVDAAAAKVLAATAPSSGARRRAPGGSKGRA